PSRSRKWNLAPLWLIAFVASREPTSDWQDVARSQEGGNLVYLGSFLAVMGIQSIRSSCP
ncbi:MAG: hypothetical protein ACKN94_04335, partial [Pirellulaceae bacterium]